MSAGCTVGKSDRGDVNNWFYSVSRGSNFQQPAGEYVVASSNWVQLRGCDCNVWRAHTALSLHYKHSWGISLPRLTWILHGCAGSALFLQWNSSFILVSQKACVNPCLSNGTDSAVAGLLHTTYYNYSYPVQYKAPFAPEVSNQETCYLWIPCYLQKILECQNC